MKCIIFAIRLDETVVGQPVLFEYSNLEEVGGLVKSTGDILVEKNGYLLHAIEGENSDVNALYDKLSQIDKYGEFIKLFDDEIEKYSFTERYLDVVPSLNRCQSFSLFVYRNKKQFAQLNPKQKAIFQEFGLFKNELKFSAKRAEIVETKRSEHSNKGFYSGKLLSLSSWVNLNSNSISEADELLGLSLRAKLLYGSHLFEDLVAAGDFGTEEQIKKVLDECKSLDSLIIREAEQTSNVSEEHVVKKSRFGINLYKKLYQWLN